MLNAFLSTTRPRKIWNGDPPIEHITCRSNLFRPMTCDVERLQQRAITGVERSGGKAYDGSYVSMLPRRVDDSVANESKLLSLGMLRKALTQSTRRRSNSSLLHFCGLFETIRSLMVASGTIFVCSASTARTLHSLLPPGVAKRLTTGPNDDTTSLPTLTLTLSYLNGEGIRKLEIRDMPIHWLRQCRHANCGRQQRKSQIASCVALSEYVWHRSRTGISGVWILKA